MTLTVNEIQSLWDNKKYQEVVDACTAWVQSNGFDVNIIRKQAEALTTLGNHEEAELVCRWALAIKPCDAATHLVYGGILGNLSRIEEAREHSKIALTLAPNHMLAAWNYSLFSLHMEDWAEGFKYYVAGKYLGGRHVRRIPFLPEGNPELWKGKHIHVYAEQGSGDIFMYTRYIKYLLDTLGCKVYFECNGLPLAYKARPDFYVFEYQEFNVVPYPCDYSVGLMDIPHFLNDPLADLDYSDLFSSLQSLLDGIETGLTEYKRRLGVIFNGSPSHSGDKYRSFQEEHVTKFLSKVDRSYRRALELNLSSPFVDKKLDKIGTFCTNWGITTNLLQKMDKIIGVDTGVIHLAAAINKKPIMMIPTNNDWRWGLSSKWGEQSPWYKDRIKIYRQDSLGDWNSLIDKMAKAGEFK